MENKGAIKYLKHHEIDFAKWDQCISNSLNSLVYACSWYLDRVCPEWEALIYGNYLYVMPLPTGSKFGIKYSLQPLFTQQLGVFSPMPVSPEILGMFIKHLLKFKWFFQLNLNYSNLLLSEEYDKKKNLTYLLDLNQEYQVIQQGFSKNTSRNLKKVYSQKFSFVQLTNILEFVDFIKLNIGEKAPEIKAKNYLMLQNLIGYAVYKNHGHIYGVYSENNTLCAAAFIVRSFQRYIYLSAASNSEGIQNKAMFFLLDQFIQKHANQDVVLDFEGSNIPGVARFYKGFGAEPVSYSTIKLNNLPWPIKLLKK